MNDQVIVITGSAQGIGEALAKSFASDDARVFGLDIEAQSNYAGFSGYQCDISKPQSVKEVFSDIAGKVDHVDLLVNNAAVWNNTTLTNSNFDTQVTAFQKAIGSGLTGSFYSTLAVLPLLEKSHNANIINMLTEHIVEGHYTTHLPATAYDCAKFSLWRLTESWAIELKGKGIRVNGLSFGATDTPMLRALSVAIAEAGMKPDDIVQAVKNVVNQGINGDTGQSYLFGTNGTSREESLLQIKELAIPVSENQGS